MTIKEEKEMIKDWINENFLISKYTLDNVVKMNKLEKLKKIREILKMSLTLPDTKIVALHYENAYQFVGTFSFDINEIKKHIVLIRK